MSVIYYLVRTNGVPTQQQPWQPQPSREKTSTRKVSQALNTMKDIKLAHTRPRYRYFYNKNKNKNIVTSVPQQNFAAGSIFWFCRWLKV